MVMLSWSVVLCCVVRNELCCIECAISTVRVMSCRTVERDRCCGVEWICVLIDCVLADCLHAGRTRADCMLAALSLC